MTRRSLCVWMFAPALLGALVVSVRAGAKPPDLPVDPNDTVPVLAPPPIVTINPDDWLVPPMPPPTTVSQPARPCMPMSVQRTLDKCLLFSAHPLLLLLPLPDDWDDDTPELIPVAPMVIQTSDGYERIGIDFNFNPPVGIQDLPSDADASAPQTAPATPCPMPMGAPPTASGCPWHGACPCDRFVPSFADAELSKSIEENLEKLTQAAKLYQSACEYADGHRYADALKCLTKVCRLCPGSRYEVMSLHLLSKIVCDLSCDGADEAEEQEPSRSPCKPHCQSDEEYSSGCCTDYFWIDPQLSMDQRLKTQVSVDFKDAPVRQILDDVSMIYNLTIWIDYQTLLNQGIDLDRHTSLRLDGVMLKTVLELLLKKHNLAYVVHQRYLEITTKEMARGPLIRQTYFVGDLLRCKATKYSTPETLVKLITDTIEPFSWADNGGVGTIDFFPLSQSLVVNQYTDAQEQIADFLAALRHLEAKASDCVEKTDGALTCGMPCSKTAGVTEQVTCLMKACHLALSCGQHAKAAELARQAYALDAERVAADPVVYKMHVLALKMDQGHCCCDDCCAEECHEKGCCCEQNGCCCPAKQSMNAWSLIGSIIVNNLPFMGPTYTPLPPPTRCFRVEMVPPALPPVDPAIVVELQKLIADEKVEVSKAKPYLEVVEEESEEHEAPKAIVKPFCVRSSPTCTVLSFDEWMHFIPGETWTEFDPKANHLRMLWRVRVGGVVYCLRYDGDLSVNMSVTPPGSTENCEGNK